MRPAQLVLRSLACVFVASVMIPTGLTGQTEHTRPLSPRGEQFIKKEVRHELVSLPWYSIFDNLAYSVNGTEVTLLGQVTQPVLKEDAEKAVKSIEGVESVKNQIEVLPVSPMDDQIRRAEFRAIYGDPALQRYAQGAVPSIHIIVKGGHVVLEGAVASEGDKNIAGIRANGVSGVFSVTNNLQVAP
jgi:hyperosmotically inducible protein